MSLPLSFHPDVAEEVDDAYRWYEKKQEGLGEEFLLALENAYVQILTMPKAHQIAQEDIRRFVIRRFPFCIYYRILSDQVQVLAVHHSKRNPNRWQSRADTKPTEEESN